MIYTQMIILYLYPHKLQKPMFSSQTKMTLYLFLYLLLIKRRNFTKIWLNMELIFNLKRIQVWNEQERAAD